MYDLVYEQMDQAGVLMAAQRKTHKDTDNFLVTVV
jgi:hypothetical protein